ncbi:T9SS type A sorting domain-containing protein [Hymenobacter ruricola]|uniref:T9SS type A sorting domain-containing protein n=1 Tax=Hymenobacter ruricola TaxID=2791023 RepID=A0ABS0I7M2_9BACT|nr:T9SS type A sorting domain-containing protein [Hymenobacter ruricola]MBF9222969.1 T9SS type A sorting domain-containing protein [Hymenobacter ruricola]
MKHPYHLLLFFLSGCLLLGAAPAARAQFLWQRTVGTAGNDETAEFMVPVAGGFVTAGKSGNQTTVPDQSLYLSKLTYQGDTVWTKRWNFRQVKVFYPEGLIVDAAGNLVVSAITFPPNSSLPRQGLLVKLTPSGDTLWTRTVASSGTNVSGLATLVLGNDGSYVAIGDLATLPTLFKYSPTGALLLAQVLTYSPTVQGSLQNLVAVPNGYLVISAPNTFPAQRTKYITVNEQGVYQFERLRGRFFPGRLQLNSRGNLLGIGGSITELTVQGDSLWSRSYQQFGVGLGLSRLVELPNGNYLAAGTRYNGHDNDLALVLTDRNGVRLRDTLLVSLQSDENVAGLALTPAGHYVVAAGTDRGTVGGGDQLFFAYRNWDRLLPTRAPTEVAARLAAYPNPTAGELTLEAGDAHLLTGAWVLYDVLGRPVQTGQLPGQARARLALAVRSTGLYLLRVTDSQRHTTQTLRIEIA